MRAVPTRTLGQLRGNIWSLRARTALQKTGAEEAAFGLEKALSAACQAQNVAWKPTLCTPRQRPRCLQHSQALTTSRAITLCNMVLPRVDDVVQCKS